MKLADLPSIANQTAMDVPLEATHGANDKAGLVCTSADASNSQHANDDANPVNDELCESGPRPALRSCSPTAGKTQIVSNHSRSGEQEKSDQEMSSTSVPGTTLTSAAPSISLPVEESKIPRQPSIGDGHRAGSSLLTPRDSQFDALTPRKMSLTAKVNQLELVTQRLEKERDVMEQRLRMAHLDLSQVSP